MEEEPVHCLEGHPMRTTFPSNLTTCDACARSSNLGGMYYSCGECDIIIHKKCANLPKRIDHPMHPEHPLILSAMNSSLQDPRPPFSTIERTCQVCKKSWGKFVYQCSSCAFHIDIMCATLEEDNYVIIPTHHHQLKRVRRAVSFICNACDDEAKEKEESYMCIQPSCGFWIHKKCGSLPEIFERPDHDHPLQLAIRMPERYFKYEFSCEICSRMFESSSWMYYCRLCKYFIHISCIANKAPSERIDQYYCYPLRSLIRETKTITQHYLSYEQQDNSDFFNQREDKEFPSYVKVNGHKHSLVLIYEDGIEVTCDGCIQLITPPYYKCGKSCDFFLHTTCTCLPQQSELEEHTNHIYGCAPHNVNLHFSSNPWEALKCRVCKSFCNGYGYKCANSISCGFFLDIKCSYLIGCIKHIGHKHRLYANLCVDSYVDSYACQCNGCGNIGNSASLYCDSCIFSLGYECATLPASVTHRWDKHPLVLTFPPFFRDSPDADEDFYCEVCEEEIHLKHWIYRCAECDQSFHPKCLPTLGECRNIKFGKTFRIQSHPHPLTLVPQAKLTTKCYYCRKSLNWSRAFECAPCEFYLCPTCMITLIKK